MKRLLLLFCCLNFFCLQAQTTDFERLYRQFRNMAAFDHTYPREKVYLHLDNSAYFAGETMWMKAYVMRASSLQSTTLSRVLYVEILDHNGFEVDRQLLRIDSVGQAEGAFKLDLPVKAGFYEVRAYTREMLNWGPEVCFSRVVPVFEKPRKEGDFSQLNIPRPESAQDLSYSHSRPYNFASPNQRQVTFYPEGGWRVSGMKQTIAYQITGGNGQPVADEIRIFDDNDQPVTASFPEHAGMGTFSLPPTMTSGGYALIRAGGKQLRFALPEADTIRKYSISAAPDKDGVSIVISGKARVPHLLGLSVTCRDKVCYFDTLTVGCEAVETYLSRDILYDGVNRIDLFDAQGNCMATRLVWKNSAIRKLNLAVSQSATTFNAFSPVAMLMKLTDDEGKPVAANLSVAIRDAEGELVASAPESDLAVSLLLSSEVRGYIDHPEYYFEADDHTHRHHLDLLLMVQGWMANDFATLTGKTPFNLIQPIEDKLTLNGRVLRDNNRNEPYPNLDLKINMFSMAGASLSGETKTDSAGAFAFVSNVDYMGDWITQISTKNEKGRYKWSRVVLNRFFDIAPRAFGYGELNLSAPKEVSQSPFISGGNAGQAPSTFQWKDTIPRTISTVLAEAEVVGKGKYGGFTGNHYSYKGGEKAGMKYADIYYNIEREVERFKDKGRSVGLIWSLIAELNDKFLFTQSTTEEGNPAEGRATGKQPGVIFKEREKATDDLRMTPEERFELQWGSNKMALFIDNELSFTAPDIWADEVKSVVVMTNRSSWLRFVPASQTSAYSSGNIEYAIFVYTRPNHYLYRSRRGKDRRVITGYAQPKAFYHPDYRRTDMPSPTDLRRTLYWNPNVKTDEQGQASIVFFSNARDRQNLRISVRGITPEGRYVSYEW